MPFSSDSDNDELLKNLVASQTSGVTPSQSNQAPEQPQDTTQNSVLSKLAGVMPVYSDKGLNPTLPPQQFLGQILNNTIGDKPATDNDSIRDSVSPVDFIAPEAASGMSSLGKSAVEAAPRLLGNEIGSIGSDVKNGTGSVKWISSPEDTAAQQYKNLPKNFFTNAQAKATAEGIGASPAEQAAMQAQGNINRQAILDRNKQQVQQGQFGNIRKMLGQ